MIESQNKNEKQNGKSKYKDDKRKRITTKKNKSQKNIKIKDEE